MSRRYRYISVFAAAVIIVAVLLCFCFVSFDNINDVFAFTTTNITSGAVDVGDILLDGYADRADGKVFNGESMAALYEKLTGKTGAEIGDVDALGTLTAKQIRAKNGNKDIVLTMDRQQWTVAYLTKDNSGSTIVTLWQASNETKHQWNTWSANNTTIAYPSDVYGTSYIRSHGLNIGSDYVASNGAASLTQSPQSETHVYARLTMPSVKGSLTDFIVKPSGVEYQSNQNQAVGGPIGALGNTLPNDAYGTPGGKVNWYSSGMSTLPSKTGYDAWKDDYIWLPSVTETGYQDTVNGIWGLSGNQRSNAVVSWVRSGHYSNATRAYTLNAGGSSCPYSDVTVSYAVRPALHLNLDLAAQHSGAVALAEPTDVSVEYKGTALALDDVADEQKKWFNADKISITYDGDIKDAGTYKVKAEIKAYLVAEGIKFTGTPDTSAGESDTVRYFNFTVTKKKIGITAALDSGGLPTVTLKNAADIYSGDTAANGQAPNFGFTYASSGGQEYDDLPTAVGTYTATAKITNECNYQIDTANSTLSVTFKIDKRSIAKPALSGQVSKPYSGVAQSFTLQGVTADVSLTLPDGVTYADGKLNAKDAGTYKIRIALTDNGVATQWADGSIAAYELTVTITKKPLNITITAPSSWKVGETPTITIVGDSLAADTTELYIYYCKHGSATKYDDINDNKVIEGKKRTIVMPVLDQGDYYIGVELFGDKQGNSNYEILVGVKTHEFKVLGNEITFTEDDVKWQYNNTPIVNTDDFKLTYTGSIFRFSIDDSKLKDMGVKIDTTKGINGYSGDVQATNAKSDTYSVTVYITEYDSTFNEFDAQYILTYTIEKAKYDLSGLSWNYNDSNPLQFVAGKAQGITLTGSLPTGLTATYAGNGNIPVGNYNTTVSFNVSDAVNYYKPASNDTNSYLGSFEWSKAWRIVKATITCSWKEDDREDAETYNLPILQSIGSLDVDSMVTYKYYDYTGGVKGEEVNPIEIDTNSERRYLAIAELKPEYTNNYELEGNEYDFTVGVNRYPVKLKMDIDGQTLPYRPEGYTPNVTVESAGGLTLDAITLTYYKDGATSGSTSIPVAVGKYVVKAELKYGGDANYIENGEFSFEIIKADIDVSNIKWQYSHGDVTATYDATVGKWLLADGTEASEFVYDGTAHTITLIGTDSLIAGISVATSGNLSESNAGGYTASAAFTYDADCYNAPDFVTALNWTVNKAIIDTSAIEWGYVDKDGNELKYTDASFIYTRISGAAVEYSVKLINLPDALKDCITYSGDYAKSEAGTHRARYSVDANKFDSDNYEQYVMPSGLGNSFDWVISPRTIDTPVYDNSWAKFDDEVHDFAEMFGLSEDWSEYVSITIKYNGEAYNGLEGEDFTDVAGKAYKGYNAGEYKVTFALINGGNNLLFSSRPQQDIPVSVAKDKFIVEGWIDNDEYSVVDGVLPSYYDYRYTDEDGNVLTTSDMEAGGYYYREVCVKDKYAVNAEVDGDYRYRFMMSLNPGTEQTPVAKPTLPTDGSKVVYYNGSERTFDAATLAELFGLTGFNAEYMEIVYEDADGTSKTGETNAGEYKIKIRFTSGLYCWDNGDGTTSTDDLELTVKISKAQLPSQWTSGAGLPTISVPESLADCLSNDAFNYTYTDEDGNTVSASDMVAGKTYSVKATLKPEYAANFEFVDASGNVLPDASVSTSHEFEYTDRDGNASGSAIDGDWYKKLLICLIIVVSIMTFIIFIIVIFFAVLIRRVKIIGEGYVLVPKAKSNERKQDSDDKSQD